MKPPPAILELHRPLVLATASPARRALVAGAGIAFIPEIVEIDETVLPGEALDAYVERLARAKAAAVIPPSLGSLIVAVDTAIGLGKEIIGKPRDELHARHILTALAGTTHVVASAIAVRDITAATTSVEVTRTEIDFIPCTPPMIDWYLATGEWQGRAGAYAIQGHGATLVAAVRGCFTNVIGISMPALIRMLSPQKKT